MKKTFALVACFAWAAVALSTVSPANAVAITTQTGSYATCSASYTTQASTGTCLEAGEYMGFPMDYMQTMKFVSTACSGGACSSDSATAATDTVYPTGRKQTYLAASCMGGKRMYDITTCAC
jgi:hypothetical protein